MLLSVPEAHTEVITSLQFSPHHASVLCSTSGDDTAALWDLRNPSDSCNIARLTHHREPVNHALFIEESEPCLLTASDDRTIAYWDVREISQPVAVIRGFGDGINKMLRLPVSRRSGNACVNGGACCLIVSACDDGAVYIHDVALCGDTRRQSGMPVEGAGDTFSSTGNLVDRFMASTSTVNDLVLSPNPNLLLTASEDCAIRLWDIGPIFGGQRTQDERLVTSFDEFENPVNHIAVINSPRVTQFVQDEGQGGHSGCWLYAACSEFIFAVDLDPVSGALGEGARTLTGHQDYVRGLEFVGDDTLLTVSDDSTVIEWSLRTSNPVRQVKLHEGLVMASAVSAARDVLATGTDGGEMRVWRLPFLTETCCGGDGC
ncbi:hypothetical protein, conserved [Trypanosoma brucei brucei TREU927]|uniref:Uncharacterized protein n=1 Tax=Trypanosoma brucei brucei (strain 927/4 GUTat10.1) TaxID=185431 RepID=Q57WE4_TRYB2|nr:hypothetical protein, conserved [Trypanosoma brucei brucei TREU927]AAX70077.1 hypothetical protein, conserved [Trypanosoma brucei]AAZ12393.1 hypothetical protein, conserved [Trypanosoma brucei brucei TREU927]